MHTAGMIPLAGDPLPTVTCDVIDTLQPSSVVRLLGVNKLGICGGAEDAAAAAGFTTAVSAAALTAVVGSSCANILVATTAVGSSAPNSRREIAKLVFDILAAAATGSARVELRN